MVSIPKPCLYCSKLSPREVCTSCKAKRQRPKTADRGLGGKHQRLAAQAVKAQPWCSNCGTRGSRSNPLSGDHIIPRSQGGKAEAGNYQVLCRRCNSSKGGKLN